MHEFTEVGIFYSRVGDFKGGVGSYIAAMVGSKKFFNESMGLKALARFDIGTECV